MSHYPTAESSDSHTASLVKLSDASKQDEHGQIAYVVFLLFDSLFKGSVLLVLLWSSHPAKRPVRSIGAAEIIAAAESIDEAKRYHCH